MNVFSRIRFVSVAGMVLVWGISTACADGGEKQADSKAATSETRQRIVKTLLDVVRDVDETAEVRASAARSLGTQTSETDADKPIMRDIRTALMEIVNSKEADPGLQIAAINALRQAHVELTKDQLKKIGEELWEKVVWRVDVDEEEEVAVAAVNQLNQYADAKHAFPPRDVTDVHVLLSMNDEEFARVLYGEVYIPEEVSSKALRNLNNSEQGLKLLIKTLSSLATKPAEKAESDIRLLSRYLSYTTPKTEGITQVLLEAASHENPDIRAAAIEALGNEIPESDEGAAPISPAAPE